MAKVWNRHLIHLEAECYFCCRDHTVWVLQRYGLQREHDGRLNVSMGRSSERNLRKISWNARWWVRDERSRLHLCNSNRRLWTRYDYVRLYLQTVDTLLIWAPDLPPFMSVLDVWSAWEIQSGKAASASWARRLNLVSRNLCNIHFF